MSLFSYLLITTTYAQTTPISGSAQGKLPNPNAGLVSSTVVTSFSSVVGLVNTACTAANWLFAAAIFLSIVFALLASLDYITSAGDPAKVKKATNRLIYAAIGVAVALVAFFIPGVVAGLLSSSVGTVCK